MKTEYGVPRIEENQDQKSQRIVGNREQQQKRDRWRLAGKASRATIAENAMSVAHGIAHPRMRLDGPNVDASVT